MTLVRLRVVTRRDEVIKLRKAGLGYAEIGRRLGISRQRAWQIVNPPKKEKAKTAHYPDMLTSRDVVKALGSSINTVRRWSDKGILKAHRIGPRRDRRFRREDIEAFIRKGDMKTTIHVQSDQLNK